MRAQQLQRPTIAILTSLYFFYYLATSTQWHLIDMANLIFHEAGHVIFLLFGPFMHALGGSLMQVLVPLVCVAYFFLRGQIFEASLLLFWVGQSLINVSIYARDAILMNLPLSAETPLIMTGTASFQCSGYWSTPHSLQTSSTPLVSVSSSVQ